MSLALCIPAYNAAKYLPTLLTSAKNQKIPFDEILVYNDCSTDNTAEVASTFGATVVNGDINRGCSFGKNTLAEICKSDWIHFHDADDDLLPNFTTLAHNWMAKSNCPDVVLFAYEYREYETNELISTRSFNKKELEHDAISYAIKEQINPFCGLYRKSNFLKAGGYDIDKKVLYNEDCAMHINIALAGLTFSAEQTVAIVNFRMSNSMSQNNYVKCIIAQQELLAKTHERLRDKKLLLKHAQVLSDKQWGIIAVLASINEWEYVKQGIKIIKDLGTKQPTNENYIFANLTRINPLLAIKTREYMIRFFKPHLRVNG